MGGGFLFSGLPCRWALSRDMVCSTLGIAYKVLKGGLTHVCCFFIPLFNRGKGEGGRGNFDSMEHTPSRDVSSLRRKKERKKKERRKKE